MRWLAAIVAAVALPALADIAPVISWSVDVTRQNPYPLTLRRGETVILQPVYNQDLTGASAAVLKTRQTGSTAVYAATGTIYSATGGVARIRLDVTATNAAYQYEIAIVSSNATLLRSYGMLTIVDSMAGEIPTTPPTGTGDTLAPSEPEGAYPNDIAPVIAWTVDPTELVPRNHTLRQGETAILQPTFEGVDFSGAAAVALRYRPTGASGWHYVAPGTIHDATGGVARVRWDSTIQGTNSVYQYEILAQSSSATLNRCYGLLTIQPSLSGSSTSMPTRVTAFDWATVDHQNIGSAPFLSAVALAPFSAFWGSLTNGTADLNVHSLLIDGVPVGTGGVARGTGTYTNTQINGISHTGAVSIVAGSNTTWRLVNGQWRVDVPIVAGPTGMTQMPATWDADLIGTNALYLKSGGQVMERHDTNGITMLHGSLELYEEDLNCNVRLYDGSRTTPSLTFRGHTNEWGLYGRGYNGNYVAAWSVAGTEVGILHAGGISLMDTNFTFNGSHAGDLSRATGYPEPLFQTWRTNMSFESLSISNLSLGASGATVRDALNVIRGTLTPSGLSTFDAGGIRRTVLDTGLTLKDSLARTVGVHNYGITTYEPQSGQPIFRLGNAYAGDDQLRIYWTDGYLKLLLSPTYGLQLNDPYINFTRATYSYDSFWLKNISGVVVFNADAGTGITMSTAAITNSGMLKLYGANGTNTVTISGQTGNFNTIGSITASSLIAPSINVTNSGTINFYQGTKLATSLSMSTNGTITAFGRQIFATNWPSFTLTNLYAGVTNVLWYANGIVTNKTP